MSVNRSLEPLRLRAGGSSSPAGGALAGGIPGVVVDDGFGAALATSSGDGDGALVADTAFATSSGDNSGGALLGGKAGGAFFGVPS